MHGNVHIDGAVSGDSLRVVAIGGSVEMAAAEYRVIDIQTGSYGRKNTNFVHIDGIKAESVRARAIEVNIFLSGSAGTADLGAVNGSIEARGLTVGAVEAKANGEGSFVGVSDVSSTATFMAVDGIVSADDLDVKSLIATSVGKSAEINMNGSAEHVILKSVGGKLYAGALSVENIIAESIDKGAFVEFAGPAGSATCKVVDGRMSGILMDSKKLDVKIFGKKASAEFFGKAESVTYDAMTGTIFADGLEAENAVAKASDGGSIDCHVTGSLEAKIPIKKGRIRYSGEPKEVIADKEDLERRIQKK